MVAESKTFRATRVHLAEVLSWAFSFVDKTPLPDSEKRKVELALEEAIVNVIEHARAEAPLSLTLTCRLEDGRQIEFDLIDNGQPFNPLAHPNSNQTHLPLEERKPGGLGLLLMKECMDALSYRFEEGKNILTFSKNLS